MECPICYDDMSIQTTKLKCGHEFHKICIDKWAENNCTCPYCRSDFRQKPRMNDDEMYLMMVYVFAYTYLMFFILFERLYG